MHLFSSRYMLSNQTLALLGQVVLTNLAAAILVDGFFPQHYCGVTILLLGFISDNSEARGYTIGLILPDSGGNKVIRGFLLARGTG